MATVNLYLRSDKNPANIYVRFSNGRGIDIPRRTNQFVNPKNWDAEREKIKNVTEVANRDEVNSKLTKLKNFIIDEFNSDFGKGEIIDGAWLEEVIKKHFNRPKTEQNKVNLDHHIYYCDFALWWMKEKAPTWKTSKNKCFDKKSIAKYTHFITKVQAYEKHKNLRLKFKAINGDTVNDFITFLEVVEKYADTTVARDKNRFKFFCNRADGMQLDVNKGFKDRVFVNIADDYMEPILNEDEIEKIFRLDLTHDQVLDNIRDGAIIGLWTGLRISDFNNRLNVDNIKDDYIDIKTSKTGEWVSIPVHPHIKAILEKRFGLLPRKYSDGYFNLQIKIICQLCNIDNVITGKIFDAETNRNKVDTLPKYKFVSSHICRRSFATNLFGIVPNWVIQALGGWKTERMMLLYIKKSKREYGEIVKQEWAKKYNLKN